MSEYPGGGERPAPSYIGYNKLIEDIKSGIIRIPKFQRNFVWDRQRSAALIDSILKGYPVGTLIFWRTQDELPAVSTIGGIDLNQGHEGGFVEYVLDGQQRIASLFAITQGTTVNKADKDVGYKNIFINLDECVDSDELVCTKKPDKPATLITVHDLLYKDFDEMKKYSEYSKQITEFQNSIKNYLFSTITIDRYPIDRAVDIFSRINTRGKILTLFDIMVAKTYQLESFDLRAKHTELQAALQDASVSYEIPQAQLLQCISVNTNKKKKCTRKIILELTTSRIEAEWDSTTSAIMKVIDHFRKAYRIPSSQLLPYPALIVPFCYFFRNNKGDPTAYQDKCLQEYFWRVSLTSRFNNAVESKLALDCTSMDEIINGKRPEYGNEFKVMQREEDIQDLRFNTGDAVNKAVLCVLASMKPQSFKNGADMILNNTNLSKTSSRNYHHFFPKAHLKKLGENENRLDLTSNITLIDAGLNSGEIRDMKPSKYMEKFSKDNPNLEDTMKTHLIDDLEEYGVWADDYGKFIKMRSARIWKELEARIEPDNA